MFWLSNFSGWMNPLDTRFNYLYRVKILSAYWLAFRSIRHILTFMNTCLLDEATFKRYTVKDLAPLAVKVTEKGARINFLPKWKPWTYLSSGAKSLTRQPYSQCGKLNKLFCPCRYVTLRWFNDVISDAKTRYSQRSRSLRMS